MNKYTGILFTLDQTETNSGIGFMIISNDEAAKPENDWSIYATRTGRTWTVYADDAPVSVSGTGSTLAIAAKRWAKAFGLDHGTALIGNDRTGAETRVTWGTPPAAPTADAPAPDADPDAATQAAANTRALEFWRAEKAFRLGRFVAADQADDYARSAAGRAARAVVVNGNDGRRITDLRQIADMVAVAQAFARDNA